MIHLDQFDNHTFDRGAPRWKELLWWLVRSLLFAPWFPIPSACKTAALRAFGARIGRGVVIRSRVHISFPWRFECGDHVWIGDEVLILSLAPVRLGSHVCLSQRAFLCTGSHNYRQPMFDLVTAPVEIGDGCWVGAQAFVGPGVTLGTGAVIAAGAVVMRSVPPETVVGGNPARPLSSNS